MNNGISEISEAVETEGTPAAEVESNTAQSEKSPMAAGRYVPLEATRAEIIAAFVMYIAAYVFCRLSYLDLTETQISLTAAGSGLLYAAMVSLFNRGRTRLRESLIWLGCYLAALTGLVFRRSEVWSTGQHCLFAVLFGLWWALVRGGDLLEGRSGRMLPLDGLDAVLIFPFRFFFLRARTAGYTVSRFWRTRILPAVRPKGKPLSHAALGWTAGALLLSAVLFTAAGSLLSAADEGFAAAMHGAADLFRFRISIDVIRALIFSLPMGAYLFAAAAGPKRIQEQELSARLYRIDALWVRLRQVPPAAWTALIAMFALLYAMFFAVQSSYLFGAFTRTLPEGFIVSEYARRGFFELCGVMAVNFALLWLVNRLSAVPVRKNRYLRAACLLLLAESALLAALALSKLALYIDCFGFTPLRLQSSWLVCSLLFGCGCAAVSIAGGKKTCFAWMVFTAVTLAALCLW